MYLKGISKS